MTTTLYVYGTLRPGNSQPIKVPGSMYDLGWFPGVKLGGTTEFLAEKIEVEDISAVDGYEGYNPDEPEMSLYIRRPFLDGFIYEFNREVSEDKRVVSGDWLEYKQQKAGRYGGRF
jgi:gamma-glutamylcyclotransferase (GGCT)/AIG2-like uncharacterized protein YtfP